MTQFGLFPTEHAPQFTHQQGIPIYRVTLVKERTAHYGMLRSSTDASRLLTQHLEGAVFMARWSRTALMWEHPLM